MGLSFPQNFNELVYNKKTGIWLLSGYTPSRMGFAGITASWNKDNTLEWIFGNFIKHGTIHEIPNFSSRAYLGPHYKQNNSVGYICGNDSSEHIGWAQPVSYWIDG